MARERKKRNPFRMTTPDWMVTFGDMTTLLLTFFVLMFTTAEIDGQELKLILSSFTGSFGINEGGLTLQEGPLAEMGQQVETLPSQTSGEKLAEMTEKEVSLKQDIEEANRVEIITEERGLKIMLLGDTFFREGSATLTREGMAKTERIGKFIQELSSQGPAYDYEVIVEGHTDNTPIGQNTVEFDTNWKLSCLRSSAIVEYWVDYQQLSPVRETLDGIAKNKFSAIGFGEYKPIASNDTPEGRARNRRIEIIIKKKNSIRD